MYKEYKEVLYRKLDKYYTFFDLIVIELEKEENFLDENFNDLKFKKIVMNINFKLNNDLKKDRQEKENIANFLIKYFNLYSYIDLIKLHQKVISYRDRLYPTSQKRTKEFFGNINCYPVNPSKNHLMEEMILLCNKFHKEKLIHRKDKLLLYDANDLSKEKGLDLTFVTGDKDFYKGIKCLLNQNKRNVIHLNDVKFSTELC